MMKVKTISLLGKSTSEKTAKKGEHREDSAVIMRLKNEI